MAVLYLDSSYTFGGAINALAHLVSALDRERFTPIVLSAQQSERLQDHFPGVTTRHWDVRLKWADNQFHSRIEGWAVFRWRPFRMLWTKGRSLWWLLVYDIPEAARIMRFARSKRVRLFHLNNGVDGMAPALIAAKLLRVPVVAHARGPVVTTGVARTYARLADHWIAVSQSVADNVRAAGVPNSKLTVIHDAIDLALFAEGEPPSSLRSDLNIPARVPVFGVFGRIVPWKGIREFILAAKKVIDQIPAAHALIVGDPSDGAESYHAEVKELAAELGIRERVIFTGFRQDVADLMRLCDVAVHTSVVPEPFGMTVIEAMATGTPVVAANAGGPTEIIPSEDYGVLVDPTDSEALAGAIAALLKDAERAESLGSNGSRRVREYYTAERYALEVEQVYTKLQSKLSEPRARL